MKEVPPLPGEEALYGWISSVWDAAAKDPDTKQALIDSFVAADSELVDSVVFISATTAGTIGNGWTAPANASQWGTDYLNRTAISKSSMYQNTPEETQYQFKETDSDGAATERKQSIHGHFSQRTTSAGERILVVDPLQRVQLLLSRIR